MRLLYNSAIVRYGAFVRMFKPSRETIATLLVFLAAGSVAAQAPRWKTYSYAADGFSISWPSDPQVSREQRPAGSGKGEAVSYFVGLPPGILGVLVFHFGGLMPGKTPDQVLEDGKNGALARSKAHLVSEKKITQGDAPGLEIVAESQTDHLRARIYLSGPGVYTVIAAYPIGKPLATAEEFLESFRLTAPSSPR